MAWSLINNFYNTFVCLVLLWFQHVKHTSQEETQGTQCSTLVSIYLDKYKSLLIILFEEKIENCRASQFCKISFIVMTFDRFLCQDRLLQGLQWVLMGFAVCSARFLVRSGGFLFWFLRKRNTPTFVRNTVIEWVIKLFFCVCKLDCRSLLNPFDLKNRQCCLRRLPLKSKEILRMLLEQIIDIWPNGHGRTRGFQALMIRVISF